MLRRIRAAHQAGKHKKADHLTDVYLNSLDARYLAVREAYAKLNSHQRPNATCLLGYARSLNAWEGTQEEVILRLIEKKGKPGQFRTIMEFGIENRALQYLVRPILKARADLHPNQYLIKGGVHAAVGRVAKLLGKGYGWAVESDIANCYASFDGEKAAERLPLPKKVTRNVLLSATLHYSLSHNSIFGPADPGDDDEVIFAELFADARRGFPQGSAASPFAVEMLLAPLFYQLPLGGGSIGYADNFLAMAREERDVVSMTTAFWSALRAHPAGQFGPKEPKSYQPGQAIEFLGHSFRRTGGSVRIDPTNENLVNFKCQMNRALRQIHRLSEDPYRATSRARELRRYVRSWTAAFGLCTDVEGYGAEALERIGKFTSGKLIVV